MCLSAEDMYLTIACGSFSVKLHPVTVTSRPWAVERREQSERLQQSATPFLGVVDKFGCASG